MNILNKVKSTAKLKRTLFFDFGKGTYNLSSNAINFMTSIINYVSREGRILCSNSFICAALQFQNKTLNRVIEELMEKQLLSEKSGYLYSHFHVLYNKKDIDSSYIKTLAVFNTAKFIKLTKLQKRLFFYIYSKGKSEAVHNFYAEAFYKNNYHPNTISYYKNFKEFSTDLIYLVEQGFLDVHINKKWYDSKNTNFGNIFREYCGINSDSQKKKRMNKQKKHKLFLRVSAEVAKNATENKATNYELELLAERHFVALEFVRKESLNKLIGIQNNLYEHFQEHGMTIYRETIERYFKVDGGDIPYFDASTDTKIVNRYVNHYLLPYLNELVTVAAAKTSNSSTLPKEIVNFFSNPKNLDTLISYFNEKSLVDHQMLLVESLEENNVNLEELQNLVEHQEGKELLVGVDTLVSTTDQVIEEFEKLLPEVSVTARKRIMYQCALEGILFDKNAMNHLVQHFKKIDKPFLAPVTQHKPVTSAITKTTIETVGPGNNTNHGKSLTEVATEVMNSSMTEEYKARLLSLYK